MALKGLKSNLTKPQPTWWSASQREGLSIRLLTGDELAGKEARSKLDIEEKGERWWTVEYSKRYRNVTKAFMGAVLSGGEQPRMSFNGLLESNIIFRSRSTVRDPVKITMARRHASTNV